MELLNFSYPFFYLSRLKNVQLQTFLVFSSFIELTSSVRPILHPLGLLGLVICPYLLSGEIKSRFIFHFASEIRRGPSSRSLDEQVT